MKNEVYDSLENLLEKRKSIKNRLDPITRFLNRGNNLDIASIRMEFKIEETSLPVYFFKSDDKTDVTKLLLNAMENTLCEELEKTESEINSLIAKKTL